MAKPIQPPILNATVGSCKWLLAVSAYNRLKLLRNRLQINTYRGVKAVIIAAGATNCWKWFVFCEGLPFLILLTNLEYIAWDYAWFSNKIFDFKPQNWRLCSLPLLAFFGVVVIRSKAFFYILGSVRLSVGYSRDWWVRYVKIVL